MGHQCPFSRDVEGLSGGRVKLAAGTLYGAINALFEKGWIAAVLGEKESRKKEYHITPQGQRMLEAELIRLRELIANGERILETP